MIDLKYMKFLKFLGVFVFLFAVFAIPIKAEGPWYNQTPDQFAKKVMDKSNPDAIFGERYTFAQINWIINSLAITISPNDPQKLIDGFKSIMEKQLKAKFRRLVIMRKWVYLALQWGYF